MKNNIIEIKSKGFAIRIIRLFQHLGKSRSEYVLSKQILRSGTSVGANIREAVNGQSRADFIAKLSISLKEASETQYWLELLYATDYITKDELESINNDCAELIALLTAVLKTSRRS